MAANYYTRRPGLLDLYPPFDTWVLRCLNWFRLRRTRTWLRADAVIENVQVREVIDEESRAQLGWRPKILYRYQVDDVSYFGTARGEIWFYEELAARETADSLTGQRIPIRYKPGSPSKSAYLPSDGAPPQLFPARPDPKTGLVILSLK